MRNHSGSTRRREFLKTLRRCHARCARRAHDHSAPVLGRDGTPGANEQIIIGVIGVGGRGNQLIDQVPAPGQIVAAADCFTRSRDRNRQEEKNELEDLPRLSRRCSTAKSSTRSSSPRRTMPARFPAFAPCMRARCVRRKAADRLHPRGRRARWTPCASTSAFSKSASQQRTMEINRFCCEFVRDGKLGKIKQVSAVNYTSSKPIRRIARRASARGR